LCFGTCGDYSLLTEKSLTMGKGDIKTRRGKIFNGSYGARRPGKTTKPTVKTVKAGRPVKKQGKMSS
jgi:ribosomal small subunit protein bTHX